MSDTVIRVESLYKKYRLGNVGISTLREEINSFWTKVKGKDNSKLKIGENILSNDTKENKFVWALQDINFEVKQGEVLGIIGKNGAGKSTLLKILSKITNPTQGRIKVKGRIASLLEVGTGFHPELTGRENIFLNGAILGMSKSEIRHKLEEIIEFSGILGHIDTPVKRYSSGMYVRLAFAVAAHLEPEILIIDEVLAVGDYDFQQKCLGKVNQVSNEGRTVIFVSHNMQIIQSISNNILLLDNGRVNMFTSQVTSTIQYYLSNKNNFSTQILSKRQDRLGSNKIKFMDLKILDKEGKERVEFYTGESMKVKVFFKIYDGLFANKKLFIGLNILDSYAQIVASIVSDELGVFFENIEDKSYFLFYIPKILLRSGNYHINLVLTHTDTRQENFLDSIENVMKFNILASDYWNSGKINRSGSHSIIPDATLNIF